MNLKALVLRDFICSAFNKSYSLTLPDTLVAKSIWRETENPPLAARAAMRLADATVSRMERATPEWHKNWSRHMSNLRLLSVGGDRWVWIVRYEWDPLFAGAGGEMPDFIIAVTMNGDVIVPYAVNVSEGPPPGAGSP